VTLPLAVPLAPTVLPFSFSEAEVTPLRNLTTGLARGDDAAWQQFHREYGPSLFRQFLAATRGDHDLASEALQRTYLRVARHARPYDSGAQFASWLRLAARSALSDCRRRRWSYFKLLRHRAADPTAQIDGDDGALFAALDASLDALAPETRALLQAKYFRRESVQDIADRLGLTAKAVESRLTRARAELRERLNLAIQETSHD
jgi:RNA polymerase sigma-70 factor (ECF subfamily)